MFILVIMLIPMLFFKVCKKCGKLDKGDEDYEKTEGDARNTGQKKKQGT